MEGLLINCTRPNSSWFDLIPVQSIHSTPGKPKHAEAKLWSLSRPTVCCLWETRENRISD
ncbi:uncharacterized protein An11g06530 [Aspergillus niger]|uniref:Contig An11c0240, genomic contig n=2 Tax=Aspergillus niger TaxID=5061 RepID=A2QWU8_ASPNC|nr:uncharacterized protein An11g06530 [Aspergillus niger]CAK96950.1 unnamed protein product [Aspergillus niger]